MHTFPSKPSRRQAVLTYLADGLQGGRTYSEREINDALQQLHTFGDPMLLRRELVERGDLKRTRSGSVYWKKEPCPDAAIPALLQEQYGLHVTDSVRLSHGVGGSNFFISAEEGQYILKAMFPDDMNHPENEAKILDTLRAANVPVSRIVPCSDGSYTFLRNERVYHLQSFVQGRVYEPNTAPDWLIPESARLLGRIVKALQPLPPLPDGLGEGFFTNMTPENAKASLQATIRLCREQNDAETEALAQEKLVMLDRLPPLPPFQGFTRGNTHGDYSVLQLLCGRIAINAVIDLTAACVHPIAWEVMRSFLLAGPSTAKGAVPKDALLAYVAAYLEENTLTAFDLENMPLLYLYQSMVCDYFGQALRAEPAHKTIMMNSARLNHAHCKTLLEIHRELGELLKTTFAK